MFDGAPIHLRCVTCSGSGKDCEDCGNTGMGRKPQEFAKR